MPGQPSLNAATQPTAAHQDTSAPEASYGPPQAFGSAPGPVPPGGGLANDAHWQAQLRTARNALIIGGCLLVVGLGISLYSLTNGRGGIITYGLVIVGIASIVRGFMARSKTKAAMRAAQAAQPGAAPYGMP